MKIIKSFMYYWCSLQIFYLIWNNKNDLKMLKNEKKKYNVKVLLILSNFEILAISIIKYIFIVFTVYYNYVQMNSNFLIVKHHLSNVAALKIKITSLIFSIIFYLIVGLLASLLFNKQEYKVNKLTNYLHNSFKNKK